MLHLDASADADEVIEPSIATSPVVAAALRRPRPARHRGRAGATSRYSTGSTRRARRVEVAGGTGHQAGPDAGVKRSGGVPARPAPSLPALNVDGLTERLVRAVFVANTWGRLTGDSA